MICCHLESIKKTIAIVITIAIGLAVVGFPSRVFAQSGVDRDLLSEIMKIKAIDNHAHPLKYVAEREKPDDEFDALPLDAIVAFPLPVRLNTNNPEFTRAWHHLHR